MATLQMLPGATVYFSYLGVVEGMDALGNPIAIAVGGFEPGHLTFQGNPPSLNTQDITDFSFTLSLPDLDGFGNPVARIIEFNDLLHFDAISDDGSFTGFTLVSETTFLNPPGPFSFSTWEDGQVFRFSVMPDQSGRLEAVSDVSTITITEGTIAIVPEPEVFALAGFGFALLAFRRHRHIWRIN
ncbi:MAG: hypothetical protein Q8Q59_03890 [Luteolibacter sp.]|nr:hypothetical protein [Luteolibacter sp.]